MLQHFYLCESCNKRPFSVHIKKKTTHFFSQMLKAKYFESLSGPVYLFFENESFEKLNVSVQTTKMSKYSLFSTLHAQCHCTQGTFKIKKGHSITENSSLQHQ